MRRRPPDQHRGYVLLLTLLLLAVAAAALAGVCRASLQKAVQAGRAQDDLQRRWTVVSCRAALLPKADAVLAAGADLQAGGGGGDAVPVDGAVTLELGGQPVTLLFGDEQAKANVNLLYAVGGRAGAERAVRQIAQAVGSTSRVELSPMLLESEAGPGAEMPLGAKDADPDADDAEAEPADEQFADLEVAPVFEGWGQVFPRAGPGELIRRRGSALPSVAGSLTCWGDGLLNVRRASREVLLAATDRVLRPADVTKLLAARAKDTDFDVWETLEASNLSEGRLADAQRLLTDESSCYSLWIVTRAGGREWYHLAVADLAAGNVSDVRSFEW